MVYVWLNDGRGTVTPGEGVTVVATPSLRLGIPGRYRQVLAAETPNKYVVLLANNPPRAIDVSLYLRNYHPLLIADLAVGQVPDQVMHVHLIHRSTELKAPECFAIKTDYEGLFRKEQQFAAPGESREVIQQRARRKYADGILALPNPNRPEKVLSRQTRAMLQRMDEQDSDAYGDLGGMMNGLFDLYGLDTLANYVPSRWQTTYWTPGDQPVDAVVDLKGTFGTYKTDSGTHNLEEIDIERDDDGNLFIAGKFRFRPGTPNEVVGDIRWRINDDGSGFEETLKPRRNGRPSWIGTLREGPNFPE
jgi:hypothetical protein